MIPYSEVTPNTQIKFKILMLGDAGVGKSCLVRRYADNHFSNHLHTTIGVDFKTCRVVVSGYPVNLLVWDTAGEERFGSVMPVYFRNAQGIVLVYDTTTSFCNITYWLQQIRTNCPKNINILLVKNKCDTLTEPQKPRDQAYVAFCGLPVLEASAKTGVGVKEVFNTIAFSVFKRIAPTPLTQIGPPPSLRDGENRLQAAQDRLQAGQDLLQSVQNRLQAGHDLIHAGQDLPDTAQNALQAGQNALQAGKDLLQVGQRLMQAGEDILQTDRGYMANTAIQPQQDNGIRLQDDQGVGERRTSGSCCS